MRRENSLLAAALVLLVLAVHQCHGDDTDSVYKFVNSRQGKSRTANYMDIVKCARDLNVGCLLDKSEDFLSDAQRKFSVEADGQAVARKTGENKPSALLESIGSIVSEITEMLFKGGISGFFRDGKEDDSSEDSAEIEDDDDDDDDDEEEEDATKAVSKTDVATSRQARHKGDNSIEPRKKKKKKEKIKATIKFLVLGVILFGKITLLLKLLSAHLQIKFLFIAFIGLLINAAKFYLDLKKGHQPQKVIYYEHAQHQHHYENDEDWSGGGGHGGGGYWSRAYEKDGEKENADVSASAQDLAYAQQKPAGINYSTKNNEDSPSAGFISWF